MDFVQTLPNNISKQILAGLEYTKKKMPTDLLATTVDVTGPQVTPPGSPIDGQVAKSAGAPVEKYILDLTTLLRYGPRFYSVNEPRFV